MSRWLALLSAALLTSACSGDTGKQAPAPTGVVPAASAANASPQGRTDALDTVLGAKLTEWTIALNNDPSTATRPSLPAALSAEVRARWGAVLAAAEAARGVADDELDDRADALDAAVLSLNQALVAGHLDYALDASVVSSADARRVLLFSFTLERHRVYQAGDQVVTVHWARRLDTLGYRYQLLGFTGRARDPLILLPAIEREMVTTVLLLVDDATKVATGSDALDALVHGAAKAAAIRAAGRDVGGLAALIARRSRLFDTLNRRLRARGVALRPPTTRLAEDGWQKDLAPWLSGAELEALAEIEAELAKPAMAVAYATLHRQLIIAVEHHEVQHQIDFAGGEKFDALGLDSSLDADSRAYIAREVSAQLSELARAQVVAPISLARIIRRATTEHRTLEWIVGRRVIGLLSGSKQPLAGEELEVAARSLLSHSPEKLSSVARAAWQRGFGRELANATLQDAGVQGAP